MVSTSSVQEVPLKMVIVRKGETVEVRRRRLVNPSYEIVARVASEFARGSYRLQYHDEDGDVVTMSSQAEWEECLTVWDRSHPLKVRIELNGGRYRSRSRSSGSDRNGRSPDRRHRAHGWHCHPTEHPFSYSWTGPHSFQSRWWPDTAQPKACSSPVAETAEKKCTNCECVAVHDSGFCCKKCQRGGKGHGRRCEQKKFESTEEAADVEPKAEASASENQEATKAEPTEATCQRQRGWWWFREAAQQLAAMGVVPQFGKGTGCKGRGRHGHWMRGAESVNPELIGQKCANCECRTTGLVDLFCCRGCMNGTGHSCRCQQLPFGGNTKEDVVVADDDNVVTRVLTKLFGEDTVEAVKKGDVSADALGCQHWLSIEDVGNGDVDLHVKVDILAATLQSMGQAAQEAGDTSAAAEWSAFLSDLQGAGTSTSASKEAAVPPEPAQNESGSSNPEAQKENTEVPVPSPEVDATIPPPPQEEPAPQPFAREIARLEEMGFSMTPRVLNEIAAANGDIEAVLAKIL